MKIKVNLSIGYPTATRQDTLEIPDEELKGDMAAMLGRENIIWNYVRDWADNYIDLWYEEVPE